MYLRRERALILLLAFFRLFSTMTHKQIKNILPE